MQPLWYSGLCLRFALTSNGQEAPCDVVFIDILLFCTDAWQAFQEVIPAEKHRIGKALTKNIEGVNTSLRARNRRLVRRTTCFSKKQANHDTVLRLMIAYRNRYHMF
jgi:IS1 family transposase